MLSIWKKSAVLKNQKGSSVVLFAIALTVILAFAALTVDIGIIVLEKSKLSSTVDSAALAGAQELLTDASNVENIVNNYILKNSGTLEQVSVEVDPVHKTVNVGGSKTIKNYFAGILGKDSQDIFSEATAKVENIKSIKGARPLAVIDQTFVYGDLYVLKEGAGDGINGNYAAMALGGTGASVYRDNLLQGYGGVMSVGDLILTETGNMAGTTETCINKLIRDCSHTPQCTYTYYNKNCTRIIFIPIVETLQLNGRDYVKVLGFGTFFLEGVTKKSGQADVIGRFITYHATGETSNDINNYGTYGIKLVK